MSVLSRRIHWIFVLLLFLPLSAYADFESYDGGDISDIPADVPNTNAADLYDDSAGWSGNQAYADYLNAVTGGAFGDYMDAVGELSDLWSQVNSIQDRLDAMSGTKLRLGFPKKHGTKLTVRGKIVTGKSCAWWLETMRYDANRLARCQYHTRTPRDAQGNSLNVHRVKFILGLVPSNAPDPYIQGE